MRGVKNIFQREITAIGQSLFILEYSVHIYHFRLHTLQATTVCYQRFNIHLDISILYSYNFFISNKVLIKKNNTEIIK